MAVGGVAVFPADTVYGLACDPDNRVAVERLYRLKRRRAGQALGGDVLRPRAGAGGAARARRAHARRRSAGCCPGGVTRAAAQPRPAGSRSPAATTRRRSACGCPSCPRLAGVSLAGAAVERQPRRRPRRAPARRRARAAPRRAADLVIDGGELPGTPSTVVDLRGYERDRRLGDRARGSGRARRRWRGALGGQFHFDPATYADDDPRGHPGLRPAPGRARGAPAAAGARRDPRARDGHGGDGAAAARRAIPERVAGRDRRERRRCWRPRARGCRAGAVDAAASARLQDRAARTARSTSWPARCASTTSTADEKRDLFARVRAVLGAGRPVRARRRRSCPSDPGDARDLADARLRQARARSPISCSGWRGGVRARRAVDRDLAVVLRGASRLSAPVIVRRVPTRPARAPTRRWYRSLASERRAAARLLQPPAGRGRSRDRRGARARARAPAADARDDRLGELRPASRCSSARARC